MSPRKTKRAAMPVATLQSMFSQNIFSIKDFTTTFFKRQVFFQQFPNNPNLLTLIALFKIQ